ncbi:hypothetical protein D1953_14985 [Peribacillus asahii]|uniref:Uncharacterized protein n=1 Tax=Peribacillus asahii TaxID=228899 RepID=A0A398B7C4_9BACI|nr:hypothetical protein [Peribacillus asahii]RID83613.1 hypothetical protein D1953_14985 [Peribacillus asahii]
MGYIASVTPYDYIQYANRTVGAGRRDKVVNRTIAAPPIKPYAREEIEGEHFMKHQWNRQRHNGRQGYENSMYVNRVHPKMIENTKARITGKGLYINELI